MSYCKSVGAQPASILFVGEAPGANEESQGIPLVGSSGDELFRMLIEAQILSVTLLRDFSPGAGEDKGYTLGHMCNNGDINNIRLTNVSRSRPPGNDMEKFFRNKTEAKREKLSEVNGRYPVPNLLNDVVALEREVRDTNPKVIVAAGNTALWALTGETGITKWRGSSLPTHKLIRPNGKPYKVIPIYHPAAILRNWPYRPITVHDLRKRVAYALTHPDYIDPWEKFEFIPTPSYKEAIYLLDSVLRLLDKDKVKIAVDIETLYRSQISSIAFALDHTTAFCIPLMTLVNPKGFWTPEEELELVLRMRKILSHPNALIIGQNYTYDQLYIHRLWLCRPNLWRDTRTMQRVAWPTLPASLDFLASMYNWEGDQHQYWKDENKEALLKDDDERRWRYNCRDAVETFQAYEQLESTIESFHLTEQIQFEMELHELTFEMGQRGIKVNQAATDALRDTMVEKCLDIEGWFTAVIGTRVQASEKAKAWWRSPKQVGTLLFDWFNIRPEFDRKSKSPSTSNDFFPIYAQREPLVKPILDRLELYRNRQTFISNVLNAKKPNGRWVTEYTVPGTETFRFASKKNGMDEGLNLQNVQGVYRVIFSPDPGFIWWDVDLDRADAQVVAWEADDEELKEAFRQGVDIHQRNADMIGCSRQEAKAGVHLTNYGGKEKTCATALNISISAARDFQETWFRLHPKIKRWHQRVQAELQVSRKVSNAWGFHCHFFDRMEDAFTNALAWIPQSTVAITINKGLLRVRNELKIPYGLTPNGNWLIEPLTQTHDSGGGQCHESIWDEVRPKLQEKFLVEIPYPDPLVIPVGLKSSPLSWGEATETSWD